VDKFLTENVKESSTWVRFAEMVFFGIAYYIAFSLTFFIAVVQFLIKLLTGSVNEQLQSLGASLGSYAKETILFLTFHSEELPFPFGLPWPKDEQVKAAKPARKSTRKPARKPAKSKTSKAAA
jgi:hypothetical protein